MPNNRLLKAFGGDEQRMSASAHWNQGPQRNPLRPPDAQRRAPGIRDLGSGAAFGPRCKTNQFRHNCPSIAPLRQ